MLIRMKEMLLGRRIYFAKRRIAWREFLDQKGYCWKFFGSKRSLVENMVFCDTIQCDKKMVQCDMNVWNDASKMTQNCHKRQFFYYWMLSQVF